MCLVSANYEVISSKHLRDFQEKVSFKIKNGDWELVGGVEAIKIGFSVTFLQAVKQKTIFFDYPSLINKTYDSRNSII